MTLQDTTVATEQKVMWGEKYDVTGQKNDLIGHINYVTGHKKITWQVIKKIKCQDRKLRDRTEKY